jgi:hypothetical protein
VITPATPLELPELYQFQSEEGVQCALAPIYANELLN